MDEYCHHVSEHASCTKVAAPQLEFLEPLHLFQFDSSPVRSSTVRSHAYCECAAPLISARIMSAIFLMSSSSGLLG
ncbi:hypothetical protein OUZ56_026596 [Daphnia magna]|uniref:Uncharacterized protein n=1 Tax=Daphnia magna TaxID=35525 RepID=A0ABQ9ZN90_9CRUS|nr:hypothetical protein OUZ56_026596 [Daphnia magna]